MKTIKNQILSIFRSCHDLSEKQILDFEDDIFRPYVEKLNQLAALEVEDHEADVLISDRELQPAIQKIARLKRVHGLRVEREQAQAIIHNAAPWETLKGFLYYPNYLQLAEMEFHGADLNRNDHVVFLGSGPLPLSLITMTSQYGVKGIGIEKEPFNANLSREVIASLELSEQIEIISGDHFVLPLPHQVNLVMVGADAIPKDEIFTHLAETLPVRMKFSYRIYEKGLRRIFDTDHVVGKLPFNLREYRRIRPKPPVNNTSVFVIKDD